MFLRSPLVTFFSILCSAAIARTANAGGTFAGSVVSYLPGAISSSSLQQSATATLGLPSSTDDGETSPFTPPFHASAITIVGAGGELTLQFAAPVLPVNGPDIGIFTNTGLVAKNTSGTITAATAASGKASTFSSDAAIISLSQNGTDWFALNNDNPIDLTIPSNAFINGSLSGTGAVNITGGTTPSDPFKPFTGTLTDFAGLTYPQMFTLFNGSFGGAWIEASASNLSEINFIRFDVPTGDRLVLDAVTATSTVPEPASIGLLAIGATALAVRRRRRSFGSSSNFLSLRKREPMKSVSMIAIAAAIASTCVAGRAHAQTLTESFATNPLTDPAVSVTGDDAANKSSRFTYNPATDSLTAHYDTALPSTKLAFSLAQHLTNANSFTFSGTFSISSANYAAPVDLSGQIASFGLLNFQTTGNNRASFNTPGDAYNIFTFDYFPETSSDFGGNSDDATVISSPAGDDFNNHFTFLFNNFALPLDQNITISSGYDASTRQIFVALNGTPFATGTLTQPFDFDSLGLTLWNDPFIGFGDDRAAADVTFSSLTVTSTPEPASLASLSLASLLLLKRRK